ncbi:MAG: T9SS type A sorting domain-containing protein [Bacteroidales bacterium]|jgi:hypothetical protein|nr:T9SS type A sorting domain-containing protein [Bacteroidales bacterium]
MKRYIAIAGLCLITQMIVGQRVTTVENFDDVNVTYSSSPSTAWQKSNEYFVSSPCSYWAMVPNMQGTTLILESQVFDFTLVTNVVLRFKQICKVSPLDTVRIEYKIPGQQWQPIPVLSYKGNGLNYREEQAFSAASYNEWKAEDSLALPSQAWWKNEFFDVGYDVGYESAVQFRFVIKRGANVGTQISYGWLLDDIEVIYSDQPINPPIVQFLPYYPMDKVTTTGPFVVKAKVKTTTTAPLIQPWLKYSYTFNNQVITDSNLLVSYSGDSLWVDTLPKLYLGSEVTYSITAYDTLGNDNLAMAGYSIQKGAATQFNGEAIYNFPDDTIGSSTNNLAIIFHASTPSSWTRSVYRYEELVGNVPTNQAVNIMSLAWYNRTYNFNYYRSSLKIWMRETMETAVTATYEDPNMAGATLIYDGSFTTQLHWNEIILSTPFALHPGSNLMLYFEDNSGISYGTTNYIYWAAHTATDSRTVYHYSTSSTTATTTTASPLIRLRLGYMAATDSNSAALISMDSPTSSGQIPSGVSQPVSVTLRNTGDNDLTSLNIRWKINSIEQTPIPWSGNLPWDYDIQLSLGTYTPSYNAFDTVMVWIESPNGGTDIVTFDDTLIFIAYGCGSPSSGTFTVGNGGYFASVKQALTIFRSCGPAAGDISLVLLPGTYNEQWDFTDLDLSMGNHTLRIYSSTHNRNDVIIRPLNVENIVNISGTSRLIVEDITFDATLSGHHAVVFRGACSKIVFNRCAMLADPTAKAAATACAIYKPSSTSIADSVVFTNNLVDGGYSGIYFYGGTSSSAYGKNIIIDSNLIQNQYYYGTYYYYTDFKSHKYNTLLSKTQDSPDTTSTAWTGYRFYACNGDIIGNRVWQRSDKINTAYGIYCAYFNYYLTQRKGFVINNEISLKTTNSGIYGTYVRANFLHNSIHIRGTGASKGFQFTDLAVNRFTVKNNNISVESTGGYPIYLANITNMIDCDIDYNNMYGTTNVGYIGGAVTSIAAWQSQVLTDVHSVSIKQSYIDSTINLELSDYSAFKCPFMMDVTQDIEQTFRIGDSTTLGCYHGLPTLNYNAFLGSIEGARGGNILGETDSIWAVLLNAGLTPLTSVSMKWTLNGVDMAASGISWSGNLAIGQSVKIFLGTLTYTGGHYQIKAWLQNTADNFTSDDTAQVGEDICSSPFSGIYSIGSDVGDDYPDLVTALNQLNICGIGGNVTFAIDSGSYVGSLDLSKLSFDMGYNTLTIRSQSGNAEDVVILPTNASANTVILQNNRNIVFEAITFDGSASPAKTILFLDACNNITFKHCRILADPTATTTAAAGIYKATSDDPCDSIFFIGNLFDGGYYNVYFYGGVAANRGTNIVFDSNIVQNAYYYAVYFYYTTLRSISHNTLTCRPGTSANTSWYGFYLNYCHSSVIDGNRIHKISDKVTTCYGLYCGNYSDSLTTDTSLIMNNEIIFHTTGTGTTCSGIYFPSQGYCKVLHNSIYSDNTAAVRGIYLGNYTHKMEIKGNNIVLRGSAAYPIYIATTSTTNNIRWLDIDNNNYWAPTNIGYCASAAKTTLAAWTAAQPTDIHSVKIDPPFNDPSINLTLANYDNLKTTLHPKVSHDILGGSRFGLNTAWGCYHGLTASNINAIMLNVSGLRGGNVYGLSDTVFATFINSGYTTITGATIDWEYNGVNGTPYFYTGNLPLEGSVTIPLGVINYSTEGENEVKAYFSSLGGLIDDVISDDTAVAKSYVCNGGIAGAYTVGAAGQYTSFAQARERLFNCTAAGDITYILLTDTIHETIDLRDFDKAMNGYRLTIRSNSLNDTARVRGTIKAGADTTATALILGNVSNAHIEGITFDSTSGYGIQFVSVCTNITIRRCQMVQSITGSSTTAKQFPVYKADNVVVDSIFFIKNYIFGGIYGVWFDGTSTLPLSTNIVFDSNDVRNQYSYGVYFYSCDVNSICRNVIYSRNANPVTTWYGLRLEYSNAKTVAYNHIRTRHIAATEYAMYLIHLNEDYANSNDWAFIHDNEMVILSSSTASCLYVAAGTHAKIIHNSMIGKGTGANRAVTVANSTATLLEMKNNLLHTTTASSYPIYLSASTVAFLSGMNFDYNNYYAPNNIGYVGNAKTTLSAWSAVLTTDVNSVNILPNYVNTGHANLRLTDYTGMDCPIYPNTDIDFSGGMRMGVISSMGCYHGVYSLPVDAKISNLTPLQQGNINGQTDTLRFDLLNLGAAELTGVTFSWSINGVLQNSVYYADTLPYGFQTTITLGTLTYVYGNITVKVWIDSLDNLTDLDNSNDTLQNEGYVCVAALSGTYTVGAGQQFTTITALVNRAMLCGINGDIDVVIMPGTYTEDIDLSNSSLITAGYKVRFTSSTAHAEDVILKITDVGFRLGNSNNITIDNITIDATEGSSAIHFIESCTNIVIRDCKILGNYTATTATTGSLIYKASASGVCDSILIINNIIDGGYAGIYAYFGTGTAAYANHIRIDSNIVTNAYYYSIYLYYSDLISCSYNTLKSRYEGMVGTTWYGIRCYDCNGDICNNRIRLGVSLATFYGMYLYYHNHYLSIDTAVIANNEIISDATGGSNYGMYIGYSVVRLLHNSIYMGSSGAAPKGIYLTGMAAGYYAQICNNYIALSADTVTAYPIYISTASNVAQMDIDYNNLYAPQSVGYVGTAISTISAWKIAANDLHSVARSPQFFDVNINLELSDTLGVGCPLNLLSTHDINGYSRAPQPNMGAYQHITHAIDAMPHSFVGMISNNPTGTLVNVKVKIQNTGTSMLNDLDIHYTYNNTNYSYHWSGAIAPQSISDTITVGTFTMLAGLQEIKLYTSNPNGMSDPRPLTDTIKMELYACDSALSGTYIIGTTGNIADMETAVELIRRCGTKGNVTLSLESGTYLNPTLNLVDLNFTDTNMLIINSLTGINTNVILKTKDKATVFFSNASHIMIENITIHANDTNNEAAIRFDPLTACSDIIIRHCRLWCDNEGTAAANSPVHRASSAILCDNISFVNNEINGGYAGIYFYGGNSNAKPFSSRIRIDSNTFTNQYYCSVFLYYINFESISSNTMLSRTSNTTTAWRGLYLYYSNGGQISKNHIRTRSANITGPYGMYSVYLSYYQATQPTIIDNNEIIIGVNTTTSGIYLGTSSQAQVFYNSIYVTGSGVSKGIYVASAGVSDVKFNQVICAADSAHPLYFSSATYATSCQSDYNNLYNAKCIGYVTNAKTNFIDWRIAVPSDHYSVSTMPSFINGGTSDLKIADSSIFECPTISQIESDIENVPRHGVTQIGSYGLRKLLDAAAMSIIVEDFVYAGTPIIPKLIVQNLGTDTIYSLTINSKYDNVLQSLVSLQSLVLAFKDTIHVSLPQLTPLIGNNNLTVWLETVNGGTDSLAASDTANLEIWGCLETLSGTYLIGDTGNFSDAEDFIFIASHCGITGDIRLEFDNTDSLPTCFDLSSIAQELENYHLTIASRTGNADDCKLYVIGKPAFILGNNSHITIENLTIITQEVQPVVLFRDDCRNINILHNKFLADTIAISEERATTLISKPTYTGIVDSLIIANNLLEGGFYGIDIAAGLSTVYGQNIIIDSNIIQKQAAAGLNISNADFNSLKHNTIRSRFDNVASTWTGISLSFCNGNIYGNKIMQKADIVAASAIEISYFNRYNTVDTGLIVNNEIMLSPIGMYAAISSKHSNIRILHNSLYITGGGASRGIYLDDQSTYVEVKNNNIVMTSPYAYPLYFAGTAEIKNRNIDYNNLYAPEHVGFIGGGISDIILWKQLLISDKHSVRINADFEAVTTSLKLNSYAGLFCPSDIHVNKDITNYPRSQQTIMGAYTFLPSAADLSIVGIENFDNNVVSGQYVAIAPTILNTGLQNIDSATFSWGLNGVKQGSLRWIAPSALTSMESQILPLGTYIVGGDSAYLLSIWIDTVNGLQENIKWNDTVSIELIVKPLAWFEQPTITDTVHQLDFTVYARILEGTGAINGTIPNLCVQSKIGEMVLFDTLPMQLNNGVWSAYVAAKYYSSKVIFTLNVQDTVGNNITLVDSTYVKFSSMSKKYRGNNLSITSVEGLNMPQTTCLPDYISLGLEITNMGDIPFDFSQDNIHLYLNILSPVIYQIDTIVNMGVLASGKSMIINMTDQFPIMTAGVYEIKSYLSSPADSLVLDDTLFSSYISGRFGLPIDEMFSNGEMSMVFKSIAEVGVNQWHIIPNGTGKDSLIRPQFGDGMLAFGGSAGSMSRLYTRQLDLSQTVKPTLSFWYYYDTVPCLDYTDVRITIDGGATYTTLYSLNKYDPYYVGWRQYNAELPAFAVNQCVFIVFEAMEKDRSGQTWQYIDRIRITAKQDIEISEIIVPDLSACDMQNKELKVVLKNLTDPILDYNNSPININLEILQTGQTFSATRNGGSLGSFAMDTITLSPNCHFVPANYTLKAYFTSVFDDNRANDTLLYNFVVNPHLHITAIANTNPSNSTTCLSKGMKIQQEVTILNDGNIEANNFVVITEIHNNSGLLETVTDTVTEPLLPDSSIYVIFDSEYTVPAEESYVVLVHLYMLDCPQLFGDSSTLVECVDLTDLSVTTLINPATGVDTVGNEHFIKAKITNEGNTDIDSVRIYAQIIANNTQIYYQIIDKDRIDANDYFDAEFALPYTVPDEPDYAIIVYLQSKDRYTFNDTLTVNRTTAKKDTTDIITHSLSMFSLNQNIPNPAYKSTKIEFAVPYNGKAIFKIYTVTGQTIYNQTIEAIEGKNNISIDLNELSAGIYFYSMEFEGQKLVRTMNIK